MVSGQRACVTNASLIARCRERKALFHIDGFGELKYRAPASSNLLTRAIVPVPANRPRRVAIDYAAYDALYFGLELSYLSNVHDHELDRAEEGRDELRLP